MKKIELAINLIRDNPGWLACPVCGSPLASGNGNAIACGRSHSFDLSASGALNLLRSKPPEDYGAMMLESRRLACKAGFFDGLLDSVTATVASHKPRGALRLLDAGCGEGSHLMAVHGRLAAQGINASAIGVDISKDAIRIAAREHTGALWLVADLARLPLTERSTDVILNILSPINYSEFHRVLHDNGVIVKVVPGSEYLKELRLALYIGEEREQYSNEQVVKLFEQRFDVLETQHLRQSFPVPEGLWPHIVAMTPLSWAASELKRAEALAALPQSVTLDFLVMAGRKKDE